MNYFDIELWTDIYNDISEKKDKEEESDSDNDYGGMDIAVLTNLIYIEERYGK